MFKLENHYLDLYRNIDCLLQKENLQNREIVLFGLNSTSYEIEKYLEQKGHSVCTYIDNHKGKVEKSVKKAYIPEEFLIPHRENVVILIASKYYSEMRTQLIKLGYREGIEIVSLMNFYNIDELLEGENLNHYEKMDDAAIRKVQISILNYVKECCKQHKLRYYLCAGTLLGAIRHKGYIPWDDDIDIFMPIQDAKKLTAILKGDSRYIPFEITGHPATCYKFYFQVIDSQTILKKWEYPFLSSSGVSIDIFPLSGLPEKREDEYVQKVAKLRAEYLQTFMNVHTEAPETVDKRDKLRKRILYLMEQYAFEQSNTVGSTVSKYKELENGQKKIYDTTIQVEFEGNFYDAPIGYHEYLEHLYGNYMELPPEEERTTTHSYRAYRLRK